MLVLLEKERNRKKHIYSVLIRIIITFVLLHIPVISLIVGSRNMIKFQKVWFCKKKIFFTKYWQFFGAFFYLFVFEFLKVQWINRKWNVMENYFLYFLFFPLHFSKTDKFAWNCWFLTSCTSNAWLRVQFSINLARGY